MADQNQQIIKIDGKEYRRSDLSERTLKYLQSLQLIDREIQSLQTKLQITQVARMAYARAIKQSMEGQKSEQEVPDIGTTNGGGAQQV